MATRIIESVRVAEAPDALWRDIGGFGAVGRWHPMLARVDSEGERPGCRRTAEGRDGSRQVERLLEISSERHCYRYRMESTGMPLRDYVGELRVENDGGSGSTVVWSADFEPTGDDEAQIVESVYSFIKAGLQNLERLHRSALGEGLATPIERMYFAWDDALSHNDTERLLALYASDAQFESPLVPHLLATESGVLHGHDELRSLFEKLAERKPPVRQYYRGGYLTDGRRLIWEYPRDAGHGEQMDFVEAMELNKQGLIQRHCVYWGWFGFRVLQRNEYHQ